MRSRSSFILASSVQVGVGGYGDDGRGVRLLLAGATALSVVAWDPLDPPAPGAFSSSRGPCGLLPEAQGAGTAVESFVRSKEARFLLWQGQFGRRAVANGSHY